MSTTPLPSVSPGQDEQDVLMLFCDPFSPAAQAPKIWSGEFPHTQDPVMVGVPSHLIPPPAPAMLPEIVQPVIVGLQLE